VTPDEFRAWYERRGWTQQQAADALGVPQQRVSDWARGKRPIRPTVQKLIEALDELAARIEAHTNQRRDG
jgi:transcriptional regulator with XRE-family HTH domain